MLVDVDGCAHHDRRAASRKWIRGVGWVVLIDGCRKTVEIAGCALMICPSKMTIPVQVEPDLDVGLVCGRGGHEQRRRDRTLYHWAMYREIVMALAEIVPRHS